MILRTAEVYRGKVTIIDSFGVTGDEGKWRTIADFACGALERLAPDVWSDYAMLPKLPGRLVNTAASGRAEPMTGFRWRPDDALLIGNEYTGVPSRLAEFAQNSVRIEMPRGYYPKPPAYSPIDPARASQIANAAAPSLNVAVAASVLLIAAHNQLSTLIKEPQP